VTQSLFLLAYLLRLTRRAPKDDGVQIISINGTSFRRYPKLVGLLENRVAALRDNDGDYQQNCVERFADVSRADTRVFSDVTCSPLINTPRC